MSTDNWSSADLYERFMGRWSRTLAAEVITRLNPPPGLRWLDIGCGTGVLSEAILKEARPTSVLAVDPSADYTAAARARLDDPRLNVAVAGADDLPVPDASIDRVGCGLVLNFVPDVTGAVREMCRVLAPAGSVTAYVWDYSQGMQMLRHFWDAAIFEDPNATELDEGRRFPICERAALQASFASADLRDVTVGSVQVPTVFADFDDYWTPFLGGQGPAPSYCRTLSQAGLERLRVRLVETLPLQADGSLRLSARAWVVSATAA